MTHGRRIALVAGVVALVIVGGSRPAVAAAVDVTNGELTYTAGVSIANALVVSLAAGTYTVDDAAESAFSLGAGAVAVGCLVVDANTVTCPEAAVNSLNVNVGDLADSVDLATIVDPATITGGTGNDVL
ncbi:MAG TPA: hypothetical protein VGV61_08880, partial [Thermoanaerobaculia bacterium]|nr:hypothetical protein [Thermoanaerobaculia bacterium]